jgi:hypothetical protein
VRFTAALVEERRVWSLRGVVWFAGILLMSVVMGAISYYYHLHEDVAPQDSEDTTTAVMNARPPISRVEL